MKKKKNTATFTERLQNVVDFGIPTFTDRLPSLSILR